MAEEMVTRAVVTVFTPALTLCPQPAAGKDREGNDGNNKYRRGSSGETCPLHINEGKFPRILPDGIGLKLDLHLFGNLLSMQSVEPPVFPEFSGIIVWRAHVEAVKFFWSFFAFKRSDLLGKTPTSDSA